MGDYIQHLDADQQEIVSATIAKLPSEVREFAQSEITFVEVPVFSAGFVIRGGFPGSMVLIDFLRCPDAQLPITIAHEIRHCMQDYENTTPEEREADAIAHADKWLAEKPPEGAATNILEQIAQTCREIQEMNI